MTGQVDDASEKNRSAATSSRKRDDEAGRAHTPNQCRPETCGGTDYDPCPLGNAEGRVAYFERLWINREAERDRLAGQVAAIRALADWLERGDIYDDRVRCIAAIRAALVASSPTTPEAPK